MISDLLYLAGRLKDSSKIEMTVETYICLLVYKYCDLRTEIRFLDTNDVYECVVSVCILDNIKHLFCSKESTEYPCILPATETEEGKVFIAGLCAVLRWCIKAHLILLPNHHSQSLLGFRGGCLVACTESSIWTRFCELQLPNSVREVSHRMRCGQTSTEIPEHLILLEEHLKRPVRTHNILKRKLDIVKKVKESTCIGGNENASSSDEVDSKANLNFTLYDSNSSPVHISEISEKLKTIFITEKSNDFLLDHSFLEGIDLTLADMIVFPCIHYLLLHLPSEAKHYVKNVLKWYERMRSVELVEQTLEKCQLLLENENNSELSTAASVTVPTIKQNSLYKRDPSHQKMKCKHQSPVHILSLLQAAAIFPKYCTNFCSRLKWSDLPPMLHPANGDLPKKRMDRKCEQIESIVTAVLKLALPDQTIVEFCAGGGHVGLLLAYFLPTCKVILVENKESSMSRAKYRTESLNLKNVSFFQCNLDYFKGTFDLGVSLHACGVATDLVIQQCIKQQASFVCCPCCYGGVQNTHLLSYPVSKKFQSTNLSYKDYILLAHCADRTEINTPTAEQGELCMGLIDTDRAYFAEEYGYKIKLTTLQPITCSPKHNLLIGFSPFWKKTCI